MFTNKDYDNMYPTTFDCYSWYNGKTSSNVYNYYLFFYSYNFIISDLFSAQNAGIHTYYCL